MNKMVCYINDNYIDIKKDSKEYHIITSSIKDGDIIDKELFINDLKNKKIFSNILTSKIEIYLNHLIMEKDIFYYKNVFEELNCNQINIFDTTKKLISPTLINSSSIYILYYKNKYYKIIPELLEQYLKLNNINDLRIISDNKLPLNKKVNYYYYNNSNKFFIK